MNREELEAQLASYDEQIHFLGSLEVDNQEEEQQRAEYILTVANAKAAVAHAILKLTNATM